MRVWTASPCLQKICPFSTPCKKLARSEAWRPAAAACNRLPREAREVARQALGPGCEELAVRLRVMPETEARPRVKNRHGGAPRGERPASWDARRLASAWYAALWRTPRVFRRAPERLSALRPPLDSGLVKQGCKPRAQKRAAGTRWAV